MTGCSYRSDSDPYMSPRPKGSTNPSSETVFLPLEDPAVTSPGGREATPHPGGSTTLPAPDITKLLYHINNTTSNLRLCIPPAVAPDVLHIAYREGHPGFSRYYEIVTRSWYIRGLVRLLREFIQHCLQCLQLQTRRHRPYGSLQPIKSPPMPFFILTLDFVLALPLSKQGFNAIMLVTCKFSKRVTPIEGADTWSTDQWAQAFLKRLDLINWGLPGELITDRDPKFLSKFWAELFARLGVKLLYSTA